MPVSVTVAPPTAPVVGTPVRRVDGRLKVTGQATYAGDFAPEGLAHLVLVGSEVACGRIEAIDVDAARAADGVVAVLTHENALPLRVPQVPFWALGEPRMPLADDVVHYAGQIVAAVVAETAEQARAAAARVCVRCRIERPRLDMDEALAEGDPDVVVSPESLQYARGDVAAALVGPGVVAVQRSYGMPVATHNPMEPSATVAVWDGDRLLIHDSTQWVRGVRDLVAEAFALPVENVRVQCPFVGGGFGAKGSVWPHTLLTAMAAKLTGRAVKLALTRREMFILSGYRPASRQLLTLAAGDDGRLTALRHETVNTTGETKDWPEMAGIATSPVFYACPNVAVTQRLVRLNVAPPTFFRAPGETAGLYALECAMDELAHELGLDPLDLRRRNHAAVDPMSGHPWSSNHLLACYQLGARRIGWDERRRPPGSTLVDGELVGLGMASAGRPYAASPASAGIVVSADGHARVRSATQDLGTGSYTVFTQIAADALDLPLDRVTFELGDTDFPAAGPSLGSTTLTSVGRAIHAAARNIRDDLAALSGDGSRTWPAGDRYGEILQQAGRAMLAPRGASTPFRMAIGPTTRGARTSARYGSTRCCPASGSPASSR
jgi:xanthine dehydrogenase YagR molybdenum-binding subunit